MSKQIGCTKIIRSPRPLIFKGVWLFLGNVGQMINQQRFCVAIMSLCCWRCLLRNANWRLSGNDGTVLQRAGSESTKCGPNNRKWTCRWTLLPGNVFLIRRILTSVVRWLPLILRFRPEDRIGPKQIGYVMDDQTLPKQHGIQAAL